MTHALILNASYEPLKVINWQRAMILLFQGKVEVLEEHEAVVHTVRYDIRMPSILRLHKYVRVKGETHVRFSRENVYRRDDHKCQYCLKVFSAKQLTLDHVVPAVQGGKKTWTNIVSACITCNQKKGGRTPTQAGMKLAEKPRVPSWLPRAPFDFTISEAPVSWWTYLSAVIAGGP